MLSRKVETILNANMKMEINVDSYHGYLSRGSPRGVMSASMTSRELRERVRVMVNQ